MSETAEHATEYLEYPRGPYVNHWLVAGPFVQTVAEPGQYAGPDFQASIARAFYGDDSGILQPPTEGNSFAVASMDAAQDRASSQQLT